MLIILPNSVAVHSTTNGSKLWETKIEKEHLLYRTNSGQLLGCMPAPFITKSIAGYLVKGMDGEDYQEATITMYDTNTGQLIGNTKLPSEAQEVQWGEIFAKGPLVCFPVGQSVHVYRAEGKQIKTHKVSFPSKYFNIKFNLYERQSYIDLLGFLAKSNVLIGSLKGKDNLLFSLDFDSALAPKSEGGSRPTFCIPKCCRSLGNPENDFKPVYRTDRTTGGVELVGVMRQKNSSRKSFKVDNGFFVTEMQYPTYL